MSRSKLVVTFIDSCLSGHALLTDVDDWVDRWHDSDSDLSLDAFLGMSEEEGSLFAERPDALRYIVAAHRQKKPVEQILNAADSYALAARSEDVNTAREVLAWLEEKGEL